MEAHTLVDLSLVKSEDRTSAWSQAVPVLFPGMKVSEVGERLSVGMVQGARLAAGRIWTIDSGPLVVTYAPWAGQLTDDLSFSLMLQLEGNICARQNRRDCELNPGALCMIDECSPFQLEIDELHARFVFLQIPRSMFVSRFPDFERITASVFGSDSCGSKILSASLLRIMESDLDPQQQWAALTGLVQFLGLLDLPEVEHDHVNIWRAKRALAFIDARLNDPQLTAEDIAKEQNISRRQLDRIFQDQYGLTLAAHLWERRLVRAAADLQNPGMRSKTITEVAMSAGFEDSAHFTRAFKQRYKTPPAKWRRTQLS